VLYVVLVTEVALFDIQVLILSVLDSYIIILSFTDSDSEFEMSRL
jgi:hypothetical protein